MARTRTLVDVETLTNLFPHRVAGSAELLALGFSAADLKKRCQPGGCWTRLAPGIVLLGLAPPTRPQLIESALRQAGPGAVLTGWDALHRHGIPTPASLGDVHVLVPHQRVIRRPALLRPERTTRLPDLLLCKGFPIAPLPRAAIDTARGLTSPDTAHALLTEVVHRGRLSPAVLRSELDAGNQRGSALPRAVLAEVSHRIYSVAEGWAHRLALRSSLPPPRWNCPIRAPDGELLATVDAWWDDVGMAWDLDNYEFHASPQTHVEAYRRGMRLAAAGILVVHTPPPRLRDNPDEVLHELRRTHLHGARRPRPAVMAGGVAGAS
jgi:hypothetical protein